MARYSVTTNSSEGGEGHRHFEISKNMFINQRTWAVIGCFAIVKGLLVIPQQDFYQAYSHILLGETREGHQSTQVASKNSSTSRCIFDIKIRIFHMKYIY